MTTDTVIRAALPGDASAIMEVAKATAMFSPPELEGMGGMVTAHLSSEEDEHHWLVMDDGGIFGAAYVSPDAMVPDVWTLWFIGLTPTVQRAGHGGHLLSAVEELAQTHNARLLLVDTSDGAFFAPARAFYKKNGFEEEARIRDYYSPGETKVTFRKRLTT